MYSDKVSIYFIQHGEDYDSLNREPALTNSAINVTDAIANGCGMNGIVDLSDIMPGSHLYNFPKSIEDKILENFTEKAYIIKKTDFTSIIEKIKLDFRLLEKLLNEHDWATETLVFTDYVDKISSYYKKPTERVVEDLSIPNVFLKSRYPLYKSLELTLEPVIWNYIKMVCIKLRISVLSLPNQKELYQINFSDLLLNLKLVNDTLFAKVCIEL
ncbi:unnamed protein product [Mucor hiemalis]